MANKMYSQVELLAEVKNPKNIATKEYVDKLLDARLQSGVECVIIDNVTGTYDPDTKTLTQTSGTINSDGVTLLERMETLFINQADKSQNGRFVVKTVPQAEIPSSAIASVSGTGITSATVSVTDFDAQLPSATTGSFLFSYDGTVNNSWMYNGSPVTLSDYGISVIGVEADGDTVTINYTQKTDAVMGVFERSPLMNDSAQLFSGMLIPVHQGLAYSDVIFQLINDSTMTLDTTPLVFEKYTGKENGAKKFKETIVGDDVTTTFTITHGLNTKEVDINIYDSTTGEKVYFTTKVITENAIEITSDVVLTPDDSFDVVVIG